MKVWAVTFQEFGGAEEIVHDERVVHTGFLLFADDQYDEALRAFQATVADRIGKGQAVYSYPGQFGVDAKVHIVARQDSEHEDCCGYDGDTIQLRPYDVFGG